MDVHLKKPCISWRGSPRTESDNGLREGISGIDIRKKAKITKFVRKNQKNNKNDNKINCSDIFIE